ncbi:hypothetical protein BJX76DRAFT_365459 [Aspergillus varians]
MGPNYVLDSRGEVILVVRNPNAPFAVWPSTDAASDISSRPTAPEVSHDESVLEDLTIKQLDSEDPTEAAQDVSDNGTEKTEPDIRTQVSAKHLALGSPVFDKMLNGKWKEGRELQEKGSIELVVEGWDIQALLVVSVEQLARIAVVADYYHCQSIQFFGPLWLRTLPKKPPSKYSRDMVLGLWVSYFFQWRTIFDAYSSSAMETSDSLISALGLPLPGKTIDDMNAKRTAAISAIVNIVYSIRDSLLDENFIHSESCSTECASMKLGAFIRHMAPFKLGLVEPNALYLGIQFSEARDVKNFQPPDWARRDIMHSANSQFAYETHICHKLGFTNMSKYVATSIGGLDSAEYAILT